MGVALLCLVGCASQAPSSTSTPSAPSCTPATLAQKVRARAAQGANGDYVHVEFFVAAGCKVLNNLLVKVRRHCGDTASGWTTTDDDVLRRLGRKVRGIGIAAIEIDERIVAWDDDSSCRIEVNAPALSIVRPSSGN